MSVTAAGSVPGRGGLSSLWNRQLDTYPDTAARMTYLGITVLSTVMLYYELYVGGSVSTLFIVKLHMTFGFLVYTTAFGALIGAFGSLFAGVTDRFGRTNIVVIGLFFTAVFVAFVIPATTTKWEFTIATWVVAVVEGMCLVATPALIRDFSPQVGRATAMGFWTSGPVLGSLIVFLVASHTIGSNPSPSFWTHEFRICGIAGLVVAVIALLGLKELSPGLRDQLMVTMKDRALVEARAKGLDIEASLRNPWKQLIKPDIVLSAVGISIFLVIYYTAVLAGLIYFTTVFGFSVKDGDALGNWNWGFNVIAVVLIGFVSDYFKVRKPFMLIGGAAAAVMTVIYLNQAGHGATTGYYHLAVLVAALAFCLGVAYVPWMASFTELVEDRNPALTATGLAIWGWIIRVIVFISYLILPSVINTVTPLVTYGPTVGAAVAGSPRYHIPGTYASEFAFAQAHPDVVAAAQKVPPSVIATATSIPSNVLAAAQQVPASVIATAQKYSTQLANAVKFAPILAAIQTHEADFLAAQSNPSAAAQAKLVQDLGGGALGASRLAELAANQAAIQGVVAAAPQLSTVQPYATQLTLMAPYSTQLTTIAPYSSELTLMAPYGAQLTALSKVPASVLTYVSAHGASVAKAASKTAHQWKTWYWICFGCMIAFLCTIPLMRGFWSPKKARAAEEEHEAMVQAELAKLSQASATA